jgi:glycosyltransferase involved in cell wall biosynthesis
VKKIVFSANTSWFLYNFYRYLIKDLIQQGHNIYILAPIDDTTKKLAEIGCLTIDLMMDNKGSNPIKDFKTWISYLIFYHKIKPDYCLHFTIKPNMYGTLAAKIIGSQSINTVTGLGTVFIQDTWVSKIAKALYKFSQPFAKIIFVLNPDDLQLLVQLRLVPAEKLRLIPGTGINTDYFTPSTPKDKIAPFTFLFIGRILKDKGIVELVEASRILKNRGLQFKTVLIGYMGVENRTAISYEKIDQWVQEGIIEYQGTPDDIRPYIDNADCIVLPSYREGIPLSLLEASAMKKPIIATDVPGCRDVVIHEVTGLICKVKNPLSLAESMQAIIQMPVNHREEMGSKGRVWVESKFELSKVYAYYHAELI